MWCRDRETYMDTSLSCQNTEGDGGEVSFPSQRIETNRDGGIARNRCSG
jgi:hypothetical protein